MKTKAGTDTLLGDVAELTLHLTNSTGGALLVATTPDAEVDRALQSEVTDRLAGQVVSHDFTYTPDRLSLAGFLRGLPPPSPRGLVFVHGLDDLPHEDRRRAIASLNLGREHLRYAGYMVVLWIRPGTAADLAMRAPDFWSWRRASLNFDLPADPSARAQILAALRLAAPGPLDKLERRYRDYVATTWQWLDFRGLLQVRNIVRLPLLDVYVPLEVSGSVQWVFNIDIGWRPERDPEPVDSREGLPFKDQRPVPTPPIPETRMSLDDALLTHRFLVLLGQPGSGKSTALKRLAVQAAAGDKMSPVADSLPILVPLVALAEADPAQCSGDTARVLAGHFRAWGLTDLEELFQQALDSGRALVLLDGLDEVLAEPGRQACCAAVQAMANAHPNCRFVVSSRVAGYAAGMLLPPFWPATLADFGQPQITAFADHWSRAYESQGASTPDSAERARLRAASLTEAITSDDAIQRLAATPLLLTLLALIHYQGTRLPQRRVELYRLCVEALAETWNLARGISGRPINLWLGDRRLDEERVVAALAPVAFWMQEEKPGGVIPRAELEARLAAYLAEAEDHPAEKAASLAHDFVDLIREQSGLLVERGLALYGFVHLTFQEYLAARHVSRQAVPFAVLRPHLHDPRWGEVVLLTAGILGAFAPPQATDLVSVIRNARSREENLLHRDFLLAVRCLADDVPVSPSLRRKLLSDFMRLWTKVPFRALQAQLSVLARALATTTMGSPVVTWLIESLSASAAQIAERAATDLGAIVTSPEVARALVRALEDSRVSVRQAAAEALGPIAGRSPEVAQALICAIQDGDAYLRLIVAEALGPAAASSPEISQALLRALESGDSNVRSTAAQALGTAAASNPEFIQILLGALAGGDSDVRSAAAQALGPVAATNSDVATVLLRAVEDRDPRMRSAAVDGLGSAVATSPEVAKALLRALEDGDARVRENAVRALGSAAATSPEVGQSLIRALEDGDAEVRSNAAEALGPAAATSPAVAQALLRALAHGDSGVRMTAARALGPAAATSPLVVQALVRALEDGGSGASWAAGALVLAAATSPEVVQALQRALERGDSEVRRAAAGALGPAAATSPEVAQALLRALADGDAGVRWAAALALGPAAATRPEGAKALLRALADGDAGVRWAAALALGPVAATGPEVAQSLLRALEDGDADVRWAAARALSQARLGGAAATQTWVALRRTLKHERHRRVRDGLFEALWYLAQAGVLEATEAKDAPTVPKGSRDTRHTSSTSSAA